MLGLALCSPHAEEALLAVCCAPSTKFSPTKIATSPSSFALAQLGQLHHHEQRVAVLLHLGPLVAVAGVLDGQLVQIELALHLAQLGVASSRSATQTKQPGCRMKRSIILDR